MSFAPAKPHVTARSMRPDRLQFTFVVGILIILLSLAARPAEAQSPDAPPNETARQTQPAASSSATATANLRAFAKLYGYVKYFHPSDAAADIDWERFAIHGARQIQNAQTPADLKSQLGALFAPFAPTIQLYTSDEAPPPPYDLLTPADTSGLQLIAWQHRGVGLGNPGPYRSIRLHRETDVPAATNFGPIVQRVDATPYRGQQIRLTAALRTTVDRSGNRAHLWLRVDRPQGKTGFFDNMSDRPVTSETWDTYQIKGPVAEDAEHILLGAFLYGEGQAWVDAFQLKVRPDNNAPWSTVPINNPGFEDRDADDGLEGWNATQQGYTFETVQHRPHEGAQSLRIASATGTRSAKALFEQHPAPGETVTKSLGRGLSAQIPLTLYSDEEKTLRPDGAPSPGDLSAALREIQLDTLTAEDEALRVGNVIIAWNVFQHFYPYFDVVDVDWDKVLTRTLQRAASDSSAENLLQTLRWMIAQLDDGHGRVLHPLTQARTGLPIRVDDIENEVVITAVVDSALSEREACVQRGDIVTALDGTPAGSVLAETQEYISGSPQWKNHRALAQFGQGQQGTTARLTLDRGGEQVDCLLSRDFTDGIPDDRPEAISELEEGVYYVDLTRAEMEAIADQMNALATADGVIFDVRGYPQGGNQAVLQLLSSDTLRSAHWQVPEMIYPDQENLAGYDTTGRWTMPPETPQLRGQTVFLTDARAISYAESVMGIVEHYGLGEIVGRPTAGANGNINPFTLPGGYRVMWTGMRVVKHDSSQHHIIGIRPTIPSQRTLEGIRAGRDEDLQRALDLIQSTNRPDSR